MGLTKNNISSSVKKEVSETSGIIIENPAEESSLPKAEETVTPLISQQDENLATFGEVQVNKPLVSELQPLSTSAETLTPCDENPASAAVQEGRPCPNCGALNDPGAKFCGNCGIALTGQE